MNSEEKKMGSGLFEIVRHPVVVVRGELQIGCHKNVDADLIWLIPLTHIIYFRYSVCACECVCVYVCDCVYFLLKECVSVTVCVCV